MREFLDERGIRYSWVADKLGITPSHMTRLLDRERPVSRASTAKLIELFGDDVRCVLPQKESGSGE